MNDLLEQHVSTINVKAGEAVFFHPALFHGSYPNSTNELRIVSAAIVLPRECNAMYFHKLSSQTAEVFEFSDLAFFENLKQLAIGLRPNGKEVNKLRYEHNEINAESLLQKIREHNAF